MEIRCAGCGESFETKSRRAKWCSDRCRKRRERGAPPAAAAGEDEAPTPGGNRAVVLAELEKLKRVDTPVGQALLTIAGRLDSPKSSGSEIAALTKELTRLFVLARAGVAVVEDEVGKARRRRDEILGDDGAAAS